jgi:hypothetical protein
MLARKEQTQMGTDLPKEWIMEVTNLLKSVYLESFKDDPRTFEVFGFTYPDELLVIISFVDNEKNVLSPVSLFISIDITEKTKLKKIKDKLLDTTGVFFDDFFQNMNHENEESVYQSHWSEGEHDGFQFFYKVSRENIRQTMEATRLLFESGFYTDTSEDEQ